MPGGDGGTPAAPVVGEELTGAAEASAAEPLLGEHASGPGIRGRVPGPAAWEMSLRRRKKVEVDHARFVVAACAR